MGVFLLSFILLASLASFLLYFARGEKYVVGPASGEVQVLAESNESTTIKKSPESIKILTWNLAYAQGKGSEGDTSIAQRSKKEMEDVLDQMAQHLLQENSDVVFLQEVDFDCARSYHINEASVLALKAHYPYIFPVESWKVNYLPFPYWPISRQFGYLRSGGAILSKYPLKNAVNYFLPKPSSQSKIYQEFYVGRYAQRATIEIADKNYILVNNHWESWDIPNKREQARLILEWLKPDLDKLIVFGGDLNALPAWAKKRNGFENNDTYIGDDSVSILSTGLSDFDEVASLKKDDPQTWTFPSWSPSRKLDHLFVPKNQLIKAEVLPTGELSDHLPIVAEIKL